MRNSGHSAPPAGVYGADRPMTLVCQENRQTIRGLDGCQAARCISEKGITLTQPPGSLGVDDGVGMDLSKSGYVFRGIEKPCSEGMLQPLELGERPGAVGVTGEFEVRQDSEPGRS